MDTRQLTELYQMLLNVKTEGQSTIIMANSLILLGSIIANGNNANDSNKKEEIHEIRKGAED